MPTTENTTTPDPRFVQDVMDAVSAAMFADVRHVEGGQFEVEVDRGRVFTVTVQAR